MFGFRKVVTKVITAAVMAMALLPPGLYTEALASPPMPYLSAADYCLEQTALWQTVTEKTDDAWKIIDGCATDDWNTIAKIVEEEIYPT